jgi:hypothetical protein
MICKDCRTQMWFRDCPVVTTLGHLPHQHVVSIADTYMRFKILEDATCTLAKLLFTPPILSEPMRRIDVIEAAKTFQMAISSVVDASESPTPQCDMYTFWTEGGWQGGNWGDDEHLKLCAVSFLVGILFDRHWIRINLSGNGGDADESSCGTVSVSSWTSAVFQSIAIHDPWKMIRLILESPGLCDIKCLGLRFVYTWWLRQYTPI